MPDSTLPQHVGFIVDGNRRWAKKHGIPTYEGHLAGYNACKDVVKAAIRSGVPYVSLYLFSTENWKRSQEEVGKLMKLVLRLLTTDLHELIDEDIRLRILGTRENVPEAVLKAIDEAEAKTAHLTGGTVVVCFNYGGWREIVDATKKCIDDGLTADDVTEQAIRDRLYGPDIPDVDMIVRTSGEQRTSNFMLWRAAYSEFMFLDKAFPDMHEEDVSVILEEYKRRNRRFGGN